MKPVPACIIFTYFLDCILQHPGGEEVLLEQAGKRQLFSLGNGARDPLDCFVCFVALRPKSTAMVIAGQSVHLTTLFPGQVWASG